MTICADMAAALIDKMGDRTDRARLLFLVGNWNAYCADRSVRDPRSPDLAMFEGVRVEQAGYEVSGFELVRR